MNSQRFGLSFQPRRLMGNMKFLTTALAVFVLILSIHAQSQTTISSACPSPLVSPTLNSLGSTYYGSFFISGQNFPQDAFVTTDGPLVLTGNATVNSAGTLVTQGYQIGCCAPQQGQTFHLSVNTPPNGSVEVADTIGLYLTEPVYSLCGAKSPSGGWIWNASNPFCPTTGCSNIPYLGYVELGGDLWNLASASPNSSVTMNFMNSLDTSVKLSNVTRKSLLTSIVGYPGVTYGYQPAGCTAAPCPTTPIIPDFQLPQQVSSLPNVWSMADYSITPQSATIDFAYDIWITQNKDQVGINAGDVELMIWTFSQNLSPSGVNIRTFTLPTWINGSLQYAKWNVYVGPSRSNALAADVSIVLENPQAQGYIGVGIGQEMVEAVVETLVGLGWSRTKLEKYWLNNITLGSEFGCSSNACLSSFNVDYSYSISNYCFVVGPTNSVPSEWSQYQCPTSSGDFFRIGKTDEGTR